ncbi:thioredoxin [Scheffersomyces amazonensis]|uniref:thioredoxin n=1 Tax=Scheffersomyces amazonensis TaxID=1078765 RepID=UPI00315D173C
MSTAATPPSKIQEIKSLAQFNEFIKSDKVTVIDFYATWCGPCKAIEPVIDALAERVPEVGFGRVDVDQAQDIAQEYGVTAMPTIFYFQNGEKLNYVVGANLQKIVQLVQEYSKVDISSR